jgi:Ni,Fe-hydrogenase III large subunit/Ni,Fe-hydrogenase III component G
MFDLATGIRQTCRQTPVQLPRQADDEMHFVVREGDDLLRVAAWAAKTGCDAVCLFATDERAVEASVFKLYLVLSTPEGRHVILEHALTLPGRPTEYPSVREAFPGVERWEQEIVELFGLTPSNLPLPAPGRAVLAGPYPTDFRPLLRTATVEGLKTTLAATPITEALRSMRLPEGVIGLSAGPIHAGIKEAGALRIQAAGETVESLHLDPGRKHRGLEKQFETCRLADGWRLAELIDGETPFAHSLAYCLAVESIAGMESPSLAQNWRAALLELERIASHIGNVSTLIHDIALPLAATPMSKLREEVRRLNEQLTGSRFLRGVNRPGGIVLAPSLTGEQLVARLNQIATRFLELGTAVAESPACRDRLIGTGALSADEARRCGASGVIRRASGEPHYDYRLRHPFGAYLRPDIRAEILSTFVEADTALPITHTLQPCVTGLRPTDLPGDDFARMVLRIAEVGTSARIIERLAPKLAAPHPTRPILTPIGDALAAADAFELGIGCVEGPRGAILHCGISGPGGRPLRWKVADPSVAALCALGLAASHRSAGGQDKVCRGDIIADVPLDNVSMNASLVACAG